MKAQTIMKRPPVEWEKTVDRMKSADRGELTRELESIAYRAAMLARYVDARYGGGCGDQGHASAVRSCNKAAKTVWMKAFGYNAHNDINF